MPIFLIFVSWILFLSPSAAHAQSTADLYDSAINQGGIYRADYSQYIKTKNQHIQYNTATTRLEAISGATKVLESRNAWEITYLKYIRQTLAEVTNIANYPQTVAFLDLETQINALLSKTNTFTNLDSFGKINAASTAWEAALPKIDISVSASQIQISSTKLAALQNNFAGIVNEATIKIGTPSASAKSTLDIIQSKYNSSVVTRQKIDQQINGFKNNTFSKGSLLAALSQARSDLLEASKLLVELSFQVQL